jgi:16S rRNA (cytosine967-C5)-methyltransferase
MKTGITPSVTAARRGAFDLLRQVESEGAYAGPLLASDRFARLSREDHALLQELTLGVLRWQAQLDHLILRYARRPLARLDPEVKIALRLGIYQLRFLERIPAHAALNESVNLVRATGRQSAAPFVNAVLRAAQREASEPILSLLEADRVPLERLAIETSHPIWLLARWSSRFGLDQAREMALADNEPAPVAFRFNPARGPEAESRVWLEEHGIAVRPSELAPGAVVIERGALPASADPVRDGRLYLQDEASQLVAHLASGEAGPDAGGRVPVRALDLCAAPGSKTTLLAAQLKPGSVVIAGDLHLHRLRLLRQIAARLGIDSIRAVQLDGTRELPFAVGFDRLLLDAPCTGLGTLQRHPEIRWRASEEKLAELAALQRRLIAGADPQVRPGGLLTYAVCSTEPEEGEEVIAWFRAGHPAYRDVTRERLIELGLDPSPFLTSTHGGRTFTHRHRSESFFFCALWKRQGRS